MAGPISLINNLWVIIAALLVFTMTIAVGLLEIGELGKDYSRSLLYGRCDMEMASYIPFCPFCVRIYPELIGTHCFHISRFVLHIHMPSCTLNPH
jgi:hypothetical protein